MNVIDTIEAYQLSAGDLVTYHDKKGEHTLEIKSVSDNTSVIVVTGYSHDTGDTVEKRFEPDDLLDLLGA